MEIKIGIGRKFQRKIAKSPYAQAKDHYNDWRNHAKESKIYICTLFALAGGVCPECGVDMVLSFTKVENERENAASLDHIIPLRETMEHNKLNLRIMCRKCNNGRDHSDLTLYK